MAAPRLHWSREIAGAFPEVFLSPSRVFVHFAEPKAAERKEPTEIVCLDHAGQTLWSKPRSCILTPLPGERLLIRDLADAGLRIVDRDGASVCVWQGPDRISTVHRFGERLAMLSESDRLTLTDLELNPGVHFDWPKDADWPDPSCMFGDHFYWFQTRRLWRCDLQGVAEDLGGIPPDLVEAAFLAYAEEKGESPLETWSPDAPSNWIPEVWRLSCDPVRGRLVLTHMLVHMLVTLTLDGTPLWCRVFAPGCCAGGGHRQADGLLVASAGCGQALTWFDDEGQVRGQILPGPEQRGAYSACVHPLRSGATVVAGGPGLLAATPEGPRWSLDVPVWRYAVSQAEDRLVLCLWENTGSYLESRFTIEGRELAEEEPSLAVETSHPT